MNKILILFAHPAFEKSRIHKTLLDSVQGLEGVFVNDLYQRYPDFDIDVRAEQQLLLEHDIIIWQHPFYWYSAPPLIKQWMDLVLEHGWAYGRNGEALQGKKIFNALSSGGDREAYTPTGYQHYSLHEFLRPFERTAGLCHMEYWPPFWIPDTFQMEKAQAERYGQLYRQLLQSLRDSRSTGSELQRLAYLNDWLSTSKTPD